MPTNDHRADESDCQRHAEATYERLFGPRDGTARTPTRSLTRILREFIFGDVFDTGILDDRARELVTVTALACLQALPQLKSHTGAALTIGLEPIQIREAIHQLAPFIGFPRTLNAVADDGPSAAWCSTQPPPPTSADDANGPRMSRYVSTGIPSDSARPAIPPFWIGVLRLFPTRSIRSPRSAMLPACRCETVTSSYHASGCCLKPGNVRTGCEEAENNHQQAGGCAARIREREEHPLCAPRSFVLSRQNSEECFLSSTNGACAKGSSQPASPPVFHYKDRDIVVNPVAPRSVLRRVTR